MSGAGGPVIRDPNSAWSRRPSGSVDGSAVGGRTDGRPERKGKLQQRERVPLCLLKDALANGRHEVGEARVWSSCRDEPSTSGSTSSSGKPP